MFWLDKIWIMRAVRPPINNLMCSVPRKIHGYPGTMYLKCYYILSETPSMAYACMGTDVKYVVIYKEFIVMACSVKRKKRRVRHESSPSLNSVLVQELVLSQKLTAFVSIAVITLFYVEAQCKRIFWISIVTQSNFTYLFIPRQTIWRYLECWRSPWITPELGISSFVM